MLPSRYSGVFAMWIRRAKPPSGSLICGPGREQRGRQTRLYGVESRKRGNRHASHSRGERALARAAGSLIRMLLMVLPLQ